MPNDFVYIEGDVPFYKSRLMDEYGIRHAFFTRNGGVSKGAFDSLNFAVGAGDVTDSEENVLRNYAIAAACFGLDGSDICRSFQTHTSLVELVADDDRGRGITKPHFDHGVDGLVTSERNLLLSVRTADCVPVLLCDKDKKVCAAVHAGWRGTVGGITKNVVSIMESQGVRRGDIIAAIGPCIGKCCYEVGVELYESFTSVSDGYSSFFEPAGDKYMLDLNMANKSILIEAGVPEQNISVLDICTQCNESLFFSHRRSGVVRGTMSAFICL